MSFRKVDPEHIESILSKLSLGEKVSTHLLDIEQTIEDKELDFAFGGKELLGDT